MLLLDLTNHSYDDNIYHNIISLLVVPSASFQLKSLLGILLQCGGLGATFDLDVMVVN